MTEWNMPRSEDSRTDQEQAPRLDIQQSWWAMHGYGEGGKEWSAEQKFEHIAKAGFTGILGRLPEPSEARRWRSLLDQYQFSFGVQSFPGSREELRLFLKEAEAFGVSYVNSQVADAFVTGSEAVSLLEGLCEEAAAVQIPYYVETHRGKLTQDLIRTAGYVREVEQLRLTIDLSHYVAAGEMIDVQQQAEPLFDQLLQRTSSIHARVSNGQQIQADIGERGEHPMLPHFKRWWSSGMSYWKSKAMPGDVLPFVTELGPPGYAITDSDSRELSDRWQQALLLKEIAMQLWNEA
ncbi:sugar phosphate isomerase/epimerase family protein [Paenibacillus sepulcri]